MEYIKEGEKMFGLKMKNEQEFIVNHIGHMGCNRALCESAWLQTDEHMQRHMFNHIFEDNPIIQNALDLSYRKGSNKKTGEPVRREMAKVLASVHKSL